MELARALVDDGRLGVAQVALDRELVAVAVGAVDLDGVEGALHGVLGGVPLGQATSRACCAGPGSSASRRARRAAGPISVPAAILAMSCLTSWCWPISWPKVRRSWAYLDGRVEARLGEPDGAGGDRVAALVDGAHRDRGSPRPPRRSGAPPGRRTSSRLMSPVLPARMPSLPWSVPVDRPGIPRSSRNAVTPLWLFERSTRGEHEEVVGDVGQADPQLLAVEPVARRRRGGRSSARLAASVPTPGSVSPNVASFSPRRLGHEPALALLLGAPTGGGPAS